MVAMQPPQRFRKGLIASKLGACRGSCWYAGSIRRSQRGWLSHQQSVKLDLGRHVGAALPRAVHINIRYPFGLEGIGQLQ